MNINRIQIGKVPVDRLSREAAVNAIDALVRSRSGGFVVTPNIDHIVLTERDSRLREAYERASLSLADGQPVVWIARALGAADVERVSGSDLLEPLMGRAAASGHRVFLFGAQPAVAAEAERRLVQRHPGLNVVGRDSSFWSPDDPEPENGSEVVRAIRSSGADLVVVALGCPKQELWMSRYGGEIGSAVAIGLGGSLDFAAGTVSRAPAWVSNAGLEWAYRLAQEPRRLAYRYLVRDLAIVPILARELVRKAGSRNAEPGVGRIAESGRASSRQEFSR